MTEAPGVFWGRKPMTYLHPQVMEPPKGTNAHNARQAVWHLGREIEIEVYPTANGWRSNDIDPIDDGRHDKGAARVLSVWAMVQPCHNENSIAEVKGVEGERSEGRIIVHLDSHQPENITAAAANLDIFPDGIRIIGPDTQGTDDRNNFAMVIRWRGRRWKAVEVLELFEGGQQDLHPQGAVYRAECIELRDVEHERNAVAAATFWGPPNAG